MWLKVISIISNDVFFRMLFDFDCESLSVGFEHFKCYQIVWNLMIFRTNRFHFNCVQVVVELTTNVVNAINQLIFFLLPIFEWARSTYKVLHDQWHFSLCYSKLLYPIVACWSNGKFYAIERDDVHK